MQKKTLISCIDDDPAVRDGIEAFLDASGFDTEFFASAEEFLQAGRLERTSCLITDVMLGGMSGLQLQERLVASGRKIPTIVITAFPSDWTRAKALGAGAICFLDKPVRAEDLLAGIDLALKSRRDGESNS